VCASECEKPSWKNQVDRLEELFGGNTCGDPEQGGTCSGEE